MAVILVLALIVVVLGGMIVGILGAHLLGLQGFRPIHLGTGPTLQIVQFTGIGAGIVAGVVFLGGRWLYRMMGRRQ